jgi:hypothetical protein
VGSSRESIRQLLIQIQINSTGCAARHRVLTKRARDRFRRERLTNTGTVWSAEFVAATYVPFMSDWSMPGIDVHLGVRR